MMVERWPFLSAKAGGCALAIVLASSHAVSAQTLFETLFGRASSAGPAGAVVSPLPYPDRAASDHERARPPATYRTVCVRLCDGYYFPIRHGVTRASFTDDAAACQARCPRESQLFYLPATGEMHDAVAVDGGTRYRNLPNAFRYRKALVDGCTCRPEPWSEEAARRHARYAAATVSGDPPEAPPASAAVTPSEARKELPQLPAMRRPDKPREAHRQTVAARPADTSIVVARGLFGSAAAKQLPVTPAKGLFGGL
jgi:hypothetical protein